MQRKSVSAKAIKNREYWHPVEDSVLCNWHLSSKKNKTKEEEIITPIWLSESIHGAFILPDFVRKSPIGYPY